MLFDHAPFFEQAKSVAHTLAAGGYVGLNLRPFQTAQGIHQAFIIFAAGVPIGCNEQIVGRQPYNTAYRTAAIDSLDYLACRVNQYVFIPDRRHSFDARGDCDVDILVNVVAYLSVRLFRQAEHRVLHGMAVTLERPVQDVGDEKITGWMTIRRESRPPALLFGFAFGSGFYSQPLK
jgi:hypothetical protein